MSASTAAGSRVLPCLAVLAAVALTVLAVSVPAWHLGRKLEDDRQFLKTFRTPYDSEAFFTYSADYAIHSSEYNDVVFLGASTCLSGIETRQFEKSTGLSAYNLGTIGIVGNAGYNLLLKSYLEHHPAPRVVVLCILPRELEELRVRIQAADGGDPARAAAVVERFLWCYGHEGDYPRPAHADPITYYVSQGLLAVWGELHGGERHYLNKPSSNLGDLSYSSLKKNFTVNRGFFCFKGSNSLPATERRDMHAEIFLPADTATLDDPYPVSPTVDAEVRRMARIAADQNILLMVRLTPELPAANEEHFDRIKAWFNRLEAACPNVICDRPEVLLYGPEYFGDIYHHLNLRGAEKFTNLVAADVTRILNSRLHGESAAPVLNPSNSNSGAGSE